MKISTILFCIAINIFGEFTYASGTGYINEKGEAIYVFKDGKKIGEFPNEKSKDQTRKLAEALPGNVNVYFTEDDVARCYHWNRSSSGSVLSCVKR